MSFQKSTALTTAAQRAVVSIADAELILIVDCSSSMSPHVLPVYTGLNELLTMQGKLPGKTRITLVLFNDSPTIIYANARLTDTSTLAASTFRPEGATALYDAVGFAVELPVNGSTSCRSTSGPR